MVWSIYGTFVLDGTEYFWFSHTGRTGRYGVILALSYLLVLNTFRFSILAVLDGMECFWYFYTGSTENIWAFHTGRTGRYGVFLALSNWMVLSTFGLFILAVRAGKDYFRHFHTGWY